MATAHAQNVLFPDLDLPLSSRAPHTEPATGPPTFRVQLLRGGQLPVQAHTLEDAGYDVSNRAVVNPHIGYEADGVTRHTLFDFTKPRTAHSFGPKIRPLPGVNGGETEYVWVLEKDEDVWIGLGFAIELSNNWWAEIRPRSSADGKHNLVVLNSGIPIDSGFRGEPVAHILNRGPASFHVRRGSRLVQLIFNRKRRVSLKAILPGESLTTSARGNGWLGSTGA